MEERLKQLQRAQRGKFQFAEERAMEKNSLRPRQAQQGLGMSEAPDALMPFYNDPAFGKINQPRVEGSGAPIEIPKSEFVREHKKLVNLLSKAGAEGKEQASELKKVQKGGVRQKRNSRKKMSRDEFMKLLSGGGDLTIHHEDDGMSEHEDSEEEESKGGAMAEAKKLVPLKGGAKKVKGKGDGRSTRGEMVSKLMKEHGMTLPEASRYIKEKNLF